jgi:hypothetical protein
LALRLRCTGVHRTATRVRLRVVHEGAGTTLLRATVSSKRRRGHKLTGTVTFRVGRRALLSTVLDPVKRTAGVDLPRLKLRGRFSATYSGNALFAPSRSH